MKRKLHINTIFMLISFGLNFGISFFVSPILVNRLGGESYAFVKLASDFTNYATIITVAINSVAARYVAISYHQGEKDSAEKYFNSVLWNNIFLTVIFIFVGFVFIPNLEKLINIPPELELDVKKLFIFMLINLCLSLICSVFTVATYVTNMLFLSSIANALSSILKVLVIIVLFKIYLPHIWIMGVASCIYSLCYGVAHYLYRIRLLPEFSISIRLLSKEKLIRMFKSGVWSSISGISNMLADGLDILISNLLVSSVVMGQISISKTISSMIASLLSQLSNLFSPELTEFYARNEKKRVLSELQMAMKYTGVISSVFFCVFIIMGDVFFELWVPSQNNIIIFRFAVLSTISILVSGVISPLNNVFVLTDHLKENAIVWLIVSMVDILIVYILLKQTTLGGYVIAGVSSIVGAIINLTYVPIIVCKYLEIERRYIYIIVIRHISVSIIGIIFLTKLDNLWFIYEYSWIIFFVKVLTYSVLVLLLNFMFQFTSNERKLIIKRLLRRD